MTTKTIFAAALLATALYLPTAHAAETHTTTTTHSVDTRSESVVYPSFLSGAYVGGQVGYNNPTNDDGQLDDTASFTGVFGYRLNPNVRTDLEISYRNNDYGFSDPSVGITGSGDFKNTSFLLNAWYDFANSTPFTPYIGGGVGLTYASADVSFPGFITTIDDSDTAFTYQLGGGVSYNLTSQLALTADYRYLDTGKFDFAVTNGLVSSIDAGDYRAHEIRAGLRYSF